MTLGQLKQAMRHADAFLTAANHVTTLVRDQGVNASDPAMADAKEAAMAAISSLEEDWMGVSFKESTPFRSPAIVSRPCS